MGLSRDQASILLLLVRDLPDLFSTQAWTQPLPPQHRTSCSLVPHLTSLLSLPACLKLGSGRWSPGIRRFPKILATAPTTHSCLCLTHCQLRVRGRVLTHNSVLPVRLSGEAQGTVDGCPPTPAFLFPVLLLFVLPILGWVRKGVWGLGRQGLRQVTKIQPRLFRQGRP